METAEPAAGRRMIEGLRGLVSVTEIGWVGSSAKGRRVNRRPTPNILEKKSSTVVDRAALTF